MNNLTDIPTVPVTPHSAPHPHLHPHSDPQQPMPPSITSGSSVDAALGRTLNTKDRDIKTYVKQMGDLEFLSVKNEKFHSKERKLFEQNNGRSPTRKEKRELWNNAAAVASRRKRTYILNLTSMLLEQACHDNRILANELLRLRRLHDSHNNLSSTESQSYTSVHSGNDIPSNPIPHDAHDGISTQTATPPHPLLAMKSSPVPVPSHSSALDSSSHQREQQQQSNAHCSTSRSVLECTQIPTISMHENATAQEANVLISSSYEDEHVDPTLLPSTQELVHVTTEEHAMMTEDEQMAIAQDELCSRGFVQETEHDLSSSIELQSLCREACPIVGIDAFVGIDRDQRPPAGNPDEFTTTA